MVYRNRAVLIFCLALSVLIFPFAKDLYAQACYVNPPTGPVVIYEDSILSGWVTYESWGINAPVQATPTNRWGSNSLKVEFTQTNSGVEFSKESGSVDTLLRPYLSFRIRKEDANGMVYVTGHMTDGMIGSWVSLTNYLVPSTPSNFVASKWYSVRVPFSAMGITPGVSIQGVIFMSSTVTTAYFDDIVILGGLSLGSPLKSEVPGPSTNWSPWSAHITSGFDHSRTLNYKKDSNSSITAWTGEIGNGTGYPSDPTCKPKTASDQYGSNFHLNGYYVGASTCGGVSYLSYNGHPGIDYRASDGTSVYAAEGGVVITNDDGSFDCPSNGSSCEFQGSQYGRIRIKHSNGYTTWYMHLSSQAGGLAPGSLVTKGQLIGYSGHTSKPSEPVGAHLHFQMAVGPFENDISIDPYGWEGLYVDPYRGDIHPVFNSRQWE